MGIFDKVLSSVVGGAAMGIGDIGSEIFHGITGTPTAEERRKTNQAINSQIQYYKDQTALSQSEIARKRDQELVEKRRINEKTIRALRTNFRPAGFMASASDDIGSTLGS